MMSFLAELRRRNVIRVGAAYLVTAWLVVQVVDTVAPAFELTWLVRVVVIAFAIGFVPVLVLAWVFELTSEGVRRDTEVETDRGFAQHAARRLDRVIIVLLTVAVGYFAVDKFLIDPARDEALREEARLEALEMSLAEASVAVLPFRNLGSDTDNGFLPAGIADEVLSSLALVPRLRVVSGHSSFAIQSETATVPEIAERLNATLLVGGSVRKVGNELRISARLIDARSDTQLWAQSFDRRYENVLALQSEISERIVAALRTELGLDIGDVPTIASAASPEAHEAYLRGRLLIRQRTPNAIGRAIDEFETATQLDPDYTIAHAELAIAIALDALYGAADKTERERIRLHAERAYELDPDLAESNAALAWLEEDGEDKLAYLRRAVAINPNYSDAWYWIYNLGVTPLALDEKFQALVKAVRIDPLSQPANWDYIHALIARNRVNDAGAQIDKYESLDPRGAILLRGLLASLGGNTSAWFLAYLNAASEDAGDLIFGRYVSWQWTWQFEQLGLVEEMLARREAEGRRDPEFEVYFGDTLQGITQTRARLAENPDSWFWSMKYGQFLAHTGELVEARPHLERGWHFLGGEDYLKRSHDLNSAILAESVIAARRADGDAAGADKVLASWQEGVRSHRATGITATYMGFYGIDYHEGITAWLAGDRQSSLHRLARAVDDGFSIPPPSAFQRERYADPAFAKLFERQKELQRRERHKVLAVVCENNPYADVWQPMETTCANYRNERTQAGD